MEKLENRKRILIWGTGVIGASKLLYEMLEAQYEIIAYCDSDRTKWGTLINGCEVKSFQEIMELSRTDAFEMMLIAVYKSETACSIQKFIVSELALAKHVEICSYSDIKDEIENAYIKKVHKNLDFGRYRIRYWEQAEIWLDNIMSEVDFWLNHVAKETAESRDDYCKRLTNDMFQSDLAANAERITEYLCGIENPLVYDIGCGLAPRFGGVLPNGKKISLVEVDPLAYFYNAINEKYAPCAFKNISFGIFEYISYFFGRGTADAVIINNALDYCIGPYKSILECLSILKPGGVLHLNHRRTEGINGVYKGLHQWNLDYTEEDEFIIWNYDTAVNVSSRLADMAEVQVSHSGEGCSRENQYICVDLIKKKDFSIEDYVDTDTEKRDMALFIRKLMEMISNPRINRIFYEML